MKELTITMPQEYWNLGLKYSGFFDQSEISDEGEWMKEIIRNKFGMMIKVGTQSEKIRIIQDSIGPNHDLDLSQIQ